ncbi:MAG: glycine/betaine ABC transporter substrate-binding protein [Clostridiales Family XIII bacterium]|jgi:osmoprotectant transport system substrate-binding protein|nr:glycine/betaine ABC transporter substrate-binding protein [Clostridiales Family XIII bacterium]
MKKLFMTVALVAVLALAGTAVLAGCGSKDADSPDGDAAAEKGTVTIGSKDFTENVILADIYQLALEDKAGLEVKRVELASSAVNTALQNGDIDLYPEYTGTGLLDVLKTTAPSNDPQVVYDTVKDAYKTQFDIIWLDYAQANDGQGVAVTKAISDQYGITTISDLQKNATEIRFVSQGEFIERSDGLPALETVYGPFAFKDKLVIDNALKYETLLKGDGDAVVAYTTEGALTNPELVLLEDDKFAWPPYNIAPVVRASVLEAYPNIADVLNAVNAKIDTPTITGLNAKVDVDGQEADKVAKEFYDSIKDQL